MFAPANTFEAYRMEYVAPILQAFTSFMWVIFAFIALFTFKPEIARALGRLKKGEFLGQKFELGGELIMLEKSAAAAANEVQALPAETRRAEIEEQTKRLDVAVKSILEQATSAPKIALISLGTEIEKRVRQAIATRGLLRGRPAVPVNQALSELQQYGVSPNLSGSLKLFGDVRNKIIHGGEATDADVLSAIDSGVTILQALTALPNEVNVVYHPGVEVYSDAACTQPMQNVRGVILETTSPGGVMKTFRIFPTTRTHFRKGKEVAWEWNLQKIWPAAWYKDPDKGEIKQAWDTAAEFIGRHLDDI